MNKRQEQKQKTRLLIVETAKKLFLKNGFLGTTTSDISKTAQIAHGTLFLHFPTKDSLILEIFDEDLQIVSQKMQNLVVNSTDLKSILKGYLDMIEQDEDLFSIIAKELPYYPNELRRKIIFRESLIRQHFHQAYRNGVNEGFYKDCDIPVTLNLFFGSLNYYLSLKDIYQEEGSVIKRFKNKLISNFIKLITNTPPDVENSKQLMELEEK